VHTISRIDGNKVDLEYRPVVVDPLTNEDQGGIRRKTSAAKARRFS
jgi:succinate dehydrogenase / fumarate reductase flavoprotein subunit